MATASVRIGILLRVATVDRRHGGRGLGFAHMLAHPSDRLTAMSPAKQLRLFRTPLGSQARLRLGGYSLNRSGACGEVEMGRRACEGGACVTVGDCIICTVAPRCDPVKLSRRTGPCPDQGEGLSREVPPPGQEGDADRRRLRRRDAQPLRPRDRSRLTGWRGPGGVPWTCARGGRGGRGFALE